MTNFRKNINIGKSIVGILAALSLFAGLLTGCGSKIEETGSRAAESASKAEESGGKKEEASSTPSGTASNSAQSGMVSSDAPSGTVSENAQPAEPEAAPPQVTLIMVGDILFHDRVALSGKLESGGYDFSAIFGETKEMIGEADLALVNQEVILGGAELGVSGYPSFNAPYELGDALMDSGFDVVLHATNHALDKRAKGLRNCLAFWQEQYPETAVLGIHDSSEDQQEIYIYEQDGLRIAILNYTYGTNGIPLPEDMPFAVDLLDRERVISDLKRARELADFVVVCPHWGTEYKLKSSKEQEKWAKLFAENGADLVLGTHPHVIEPIAWVGGKDDAASASDGDADAGALVYYSLGNFVNWTSGMGDGVANRMVGGMARVTIGLDEAGEAQILSYGVEPLVCHVEQGFGGVRVYPLEEYTEELAAHNEILRQDGHFSLEYCRKLVEDVFGELAVTDTVRK